MIGDIVPGALIVTTIIGIIIISAAGYFALVPVVLLLGSFLAGFIAKEAKSGALAGFIITFSVLIIIGIIFAILLFIAMILIIPLLLGLSLESETLDTILITLAWPAILSPITGALGGFMGRLLFDRKTEPVPPRPQIPPLATLPPRTPPPATPPPIITPPGIPKTISGFGGLRKIPPPTKNALICLSCGTPNSPQARFCSTCGLALK